MKSRLAFTLIELVITLVIAILIFVTILPQFGQFREKYTLNQTAEVIRRTVLEARTKAMAPSGAISKNAYQVLFYKGISKKDGLNNYPLKLKAVTIPCGTTTPDSNPLDLKKEEFTEGIIISQFTPNPSARNDTWINFAIGPGQFTCQDKSPLDQTFWGTATNLEMILSDTRTNNEKKILINKYTGDVWIEDVPIE